jgi:signal transduction histidine kinase/DNA-binding response OmpR family regulator
MPVPRAKTAVRNGVRLRRITSGPPRPATATDSTPSAHAQRRRRSDAEPSEQVGSSGTALMAANDSPESGAGGSPHQPELLPGRTLLVEDDESTRELLKTVLELRGHRVAEFADGERAWEAYRRGDFPLAVIDWQLPGIDGVELCRRMRATPRGEATVVLAITGRTSPQDLQAMLDAGANDYLTKPFDLPTLEVRLTIAEQQARRAFERQRGELLEHDRNEILEQIARNEPLRDILTSLAELLERQRPELACCVWLAADGRLSVQAAPSLPEPVIRALDQISLDDESFPWATGWRSGLVTSVELVSDPRRLRQREVLERFDLRACWAVPIRVSGGPLLGVLALFDGQSGAPSAAGRRLLEAAGRLAALAIDHARLFDEAATVEALRGLARLKSEFLSTVSHELRTPLSLIYGYAELLTERGPSLSSNEVLEMAAEIHTSSSTMIRLVDDLLDFARIEQGRLSLDARQVDVSELVRGLVATFSHQPGGDRLRAELPSRLEATIDPERLVQVVGNLITNALRYAPAGPIELALEASRGWLRVEVSDQGPGIAAEEQSRVWEKFYRGSLAMSAAPRGSGLGLAVVKHLVELQGGRVGLQSVLGGGSTFWFTLPIRAG